MAIKVYCGRCGKALVAKDELAGKVVNCPKCRSKVPIPTSDLDKPQIRLLCSGCGSKMKAMPEQADEDMQCPKCNRLIHLPTIEKEPPGGRAKVRAPRPPRREAVSAKAGTKPKKGGLTVEELERMAEKAKGDTKAVELPPSGPSAPEEREEPAPAGAPAEREAKPSRAGGEALDELAAAASDGPPDVAEELDEEVDEAIEKIDFDTYQKAREEEELEEVVGGKSKALLIGIVAGILVLALIFLMFVLR